MKDNGYSDLLLDRIEYKLMVSSESIDSFIKSVLEINTDDMSTQDLQNKYQESLIMLTAANEVIDGAICMLGTYQNHVEEKRVDILANI